jgi:hypothetical protein
VALTVALALAAGCVTTTTRAFLPSPQNPIYTVAKAEPVLSEYLRLQCAPLRKAQRPDSGTARFVVDIDTLGFATRAELARGTGDETLDGVFGTVAAQLTFERTRAVRRERVDMRYRCDGEDARVSLHLGKPKA